MSDLEKLNNYNNLSVLGLTLNVSTSIDKGNYIG
jgi:hypothetical protein